MAGTASGTHGSDCRAPGSGGGTSSDLQGLWNHLGSNKMSAWAGGGKGLGQVYRRVEEIAAPWSVPGDRPEPLVSDPPLSPETRMQALRKSKRLYV